MKGPRWTMPGEVYVYRTRKPGALLGSPVAGALLGAGAVAGGVWALDLPWWGSGLLGVLAALWGSGRHIGYVGQTRNPKARHGEHTKGGGRYGKAPANWSDLDPKRYVVFRLRRCPQWVLDLMELVFIRALLPAYNVKMNMGNPRRITPARATAQREARNSRHFRLHLRAYHLIPLAVLAVMVYRGL